MEDWRIALRKAARGLATVPAEGPEFATDSTQVLEDTLGPVERSVQAEASVIRRLFGGGRAVSIDFASGVATACVSGALFGGTAAGAATAGVSAIAAWTIGALMPPKRDGVGHVVAYLRQLQS